MSERPALPDLGPRLRLAARAVGPGYDVPEVDALRPRATDERRATFLAGRAAARAAVAWLDPSWAGRVEADALGRPWIQAPAIEISITHAAGWALAAAARAPVGVDLVAGGSLSGAAFEEAIAPDERAAWGDDDRGRCLAFAAKEAALKWLGVGMNVPLHAVRVRPLAPVELGVEHEARARIEHPSGRVELPLRLFALRGLEGPERWVALLGG